MTRDGFWLPLAITLGLSVSCGGGADIAAPPTPGTLTVTLATPRDDDGALLVTLHGPVAPTAITAHPGLRLFMGSAPATTTRLVLTGAISRGAILSLSVPDVAQASDFTGSVEEVASSSFEIGIATDYSLSVAQ